MELMLTKVRISLVFAACLALTGCGTTYVAQAAKGQFQILTARRSIDRVLADPKSTPELRKRLESVRAAREFAARELGLPNNKSYTSYVDLKREYVVWSVVAILVIVISGPEHLSRKYRKQEEALPDSEPLPNRQGA